MEEGPRWESAIVGRRWEGGVIDSVPRSKLLCSHERYSQQGQNGAPRSDFDFVKKKKKKFIVSFFVIGHYYEDSSIRLLRVSWSLRLGGHYPLVSMFFFCRLSRPTVGLCTCTELVFVLVLVYTSSIPDELIYPRFPNAICTNNP
jgi:hypothetical protein